MRETGEINLISCVSCVQQEVTKTLTDFNNIEDQRILAGLAEK